MWIKIMEVIKKYWLVSLLIVLAVVWGMTSCFKNRALYDELSVIKGKKDTIAEEYASYRNDAEQRIKGLQRDIVALDEAKIKLAKSVDEKTKEIIKIQPTITRLEEARKILTDKDAIIINQDLQIQQYVALIDQQEKRFLELRDAFIVVDQQKNASIALAKEYHDLWQKELQLRKISEDTYKALEAKYKSRGFKITIKGIGEKVLFAGLGYGIGRLTGGK